MSSNDETGDSTLSLTMTVIFNTLAIVIESYAVYRLWYMASGLVFIGLLWMWVHAVEKSLLNIFKALKVKKITVKVNNPLRAYRDRLIKIRKE